MQATRKRLWFWILVAALVAAVVVFLFWPKSLAVDLAVIESGPLEVTIDEEGEARVRDTFVLYAPVAGRMSRIDAEVGDAVVAGETVIARIEPVDPSLLDIRSLAETRAAVTSAEAVERLASARLAEAEADFAFAQAEFKRASRLRDEGNLSARDFDSADRTRRTSLAALDSATASLALSHSDLDRARAALISPLGPLELLATKESVACAPLAKKQPVACLPLAAPADGRILQTFRTSAGLVQAGESLVEIGDTRDLEIVADLLSSDAIGVQSGQRVRIDDWGGGTSLEGRVRRVEPFARTRVSALGIEEQRVSISIDLLSPPEEREGLGHGYQLTIHIVRWQGDDVLTVPLTALFRDGNSWAIYVERDGRAIRQRISVGHRSTRRAEIVDGVEVGAHIVVNPGSALTDGARIKARDAA